MPSIVLRYCSRLSSQPPRGTVAMFAAPSVAATMRSSGAGWSEKTP